MRVLGARPARGLAVALVAACAAAATARADDAVVLGPHTRVVGHAASPETLAAARDALERAVPVLEAALPWRLPASARLVLHVYGDAEPYGAAMRAAGAPELVDNLAATLYRTHESHVVLQPRDAPAVRALVGGTPQYFRWVVAHELVHQWLARAGARSREWWPSWFEEGLCEWGAERVVAAEDPAGVPPIAADDRADLVAELLAHDRFLPLDRLLHLQVQDFVPERAAYAHAWSFVRFLGADAARWRALCARVEALPAPPEGGRGVRVVALERWFAAALVDVYGPLAALESRWKAAIGAARPRWSEPTRSAQRLDDGGLLLCAFPGGAAQLVAVAPPPAPSWTLSGTLRILDEGERQADLLFGYERRDDARFAKLALGASGYVTLLAYASGAWQDRYRVNAKVDPATFAVDRDVAFRLTVAGGRIRLDVGGAPVFDAEAPPGFDVARGRWGLGAHQGAVLYRDVAVAPAR